MVRALIHICRVMLYNFTIKFANKKIAKIHSNIHDEKIRVARMESDLAIYEAERAELAL